MFLRIKTITIGDTVYEVDKPIRVIDIDLPGRRLSDYGMTIDDLNRNGLVIPDYEERKAELDRRDREAAQDAQPDGSDLDDAPEPTRREALQWTDQSYPHPKLRRIPNLHKRRN